MIRIPSKHITTENGPAIIPDGEAPAGWKVRYIGGEFQAIPPDQEWPE